MRVYLDKRRPLKGTEIVALSGIEHTAVKSNDKGPREEHGKQWKK